MIIFKRLKLLYMKKKMLALLTGGLLVSTLLVRRLRAMPHPIAKMQHHQS